MDTADWERLEAAVIGDDGDLPDGVVHDVGLSGWQALLDLTRQRSWTCEFTVDREPRALPGKAVDLFDSAAFCLLGIWITPVIRINVYPSLARESIYFDFDTRQLAAGGLRAIGDFARDLGRAVGAPVKLSYEGDESAVFLVYDPMSDAFQASD